MSRKSPHRRVAWLALVALIAALWYPAGASAHAFLPREHGLFYVTATLPLRDPEPTAHAVLLEIERLIAEPPSVDELSSGKAAALSSSSDAAAIARAHAWAETVVGARGQLAYHDRVLRVSPENVRAAARACALPVRAGAAPKAPPRARR